MTQTAPIRAAQRAPDVAASALQRKCDCGSTAGVLSSECGDCARKKAVGLQRKLRIGRSDDPLEHEADRVADEVIRPPMQGVRQRPNGFGDTAKTPQADRSQTPPPIQRRVEGRQDAEVPPIVHDVLRSPGRPLEPAVRRFFESRFGHDFGMVRIHTDTLASASAQAVSARAYTVGRNVAFAAGQYAPEGSSGTQLLAHELAHVVQQGGGAPWSAYTSTRHHGPRQSAHPRALTLRRAPAPTAVPGGAPGVPGGQLTPAVPSGARNVPPTAPAPARAAAATVCPTCACASNQVSRIDDGRMKAKAVLERAAGLLGNPTNALERQFENTFGQGSNSAKTLTETADRYRAAAVFLDQSAVSDPPGSGNIHCDSTNATDLCAGGASAHYGQGNVVVCSENPAPKQMLNPPKVNPVYRTEGEAGSTEGIRQVPDPDATDAAQAASDATFATRVTAVLAHEAIHHVVQPGVVDVYTNERLFRFLGAGSKKLGVDLSPLALQNPDSLVLFAFRSFVLDAGSDALPGAEKALESSEKFSGKLGVRPLLGRQQAKLGVALAEEAIAQAEERLGVLHSEIKSVQGGPSTWTVFPALSQQVVTSLVTLGNEIDFGQPDAAALARMQTIVDAFSRLSTAIRDRKVVLGRRFLTDRPAKRIEVAIPDWRAFRKMTVGDQLPILLGALLDEEADIAGLDAFVLDLAKKRGGMGKL